MKVTLHYLLFETTSAYIQGRIQGRGRSPTLKPTKINIFTMIFYNSQNSIRDLRPFYRPLFYHSSVVKYTSSPLQ